MRTRSSLTVAVALLSVSLWSQTYAFGQSTAHIEVFQPAAASPTDATTDAAKQPDRSEVIQIDAYWVRLTPQQLAGIDRSPAAGVAAVLGDASAVYCRARTIGFNHQTMTMSVGQTRPVVTSVTPVVAPGVALYEPTIGEQKSGVSLQVTPDYNGKRLVVAVESAVHDFAQSENKTQATDAKVGPKDAAPATQPADQTDPAYADAVHHMLDSAQVDQEIKTTLELTPGVPLVVGGMSEHPGAGEPRALFLVLVANLNQPELAKPASTK